MRLDDIIGCLTRREDDRGWTNEKRNGKPVMKRQRRLVEREQRATVLLNRERAIFFWIFTLCLFVHGPDFWIFDWEHNKSARVLPEKWLHLLFLQFVVVRIKTKRLF